MIIFARVLHKEFNEKYLVRKIEELFITFQAKIKDVDEDHNKKVIKYLRENREKELFANEYLDNNFYKFVEIFKECELDDYLRKEKDDLRNAYYNQNNNCKDGILINNIDERVCDFEKIIRTIFDKDIFKEYSISI